MEEPIALGALTRFPTPLTVVQFANSCSSIARHPEGDERRDTIPLRAFCQGGHTERRFANGTFAPVSVVLDGRIDESLHNGILEIRVHQTVRARSLNHE